MMKQSKKIIMLVGEVKTSNYMYNGLSKVFNIDLVIQEKPINRKNIIKNRVKRLGYFNVFGQVLFGVLLLPFIRFFSRKRYNTIQKSLSLSPEPIPENKTKIVDSVNSKETINLLNKIKPDIIIVNGCRVISNKVLTAINAKFINTHEGITPRYRGIHGGYWALVNRDKENCGVTVHLVDKGIDTGAIIYQDLISPTSKDNFCTYHLHQSAKGIPLMKKAIQDIIDNNLILKKGKLESSIWYHPTIWQYLYFRVFRGVK